MMHTDPIADLLTRIRNAYRAGREIVNISHSKLKEEIVKNLVQTKWIKKYEVKGEGILKALEITLQNEQIPMEIKRISKPGRRIYLKNTEIKPVLNGFGVALISTSKGIMSDRKARKEKLGGELICEIY
ncbi:30S ribosomal protein S8 [Candidatus Peregrinibacteria bacterium]|nr:30S ribosomal protein S8 [Candidatus Peregrinibacteria bacterium]